MKILNVLCLVTSAPFLSACYNTTLPFSTTNVSAKSYTESASLTIHEAHPLKGSEKVSVHAYSYTRGSDHCARTIALNFTSSLAFTQTMIALRNRAMVTGANALSITNWREHDGMTTLTGHFFDCHSKKGLWTVTLIHFTKKWSKWFQTSVDQIERFYAKYLPLSAEMASVRRQGFWNQLRLKLKES